MNKVLVFAFEGTISEKVLAQLLCRYKLIIKSDAHKLDRYIENILKENFTYIIGLGEYSGKDKDKLRVERQCTNRFRNIILGRQYESISISEFLLPSNNTKLSMGIGNSYCNLISFLLASSIKSKKMNTQYGFIHVPKKFEIDRAVIEIGSLIQGFE